LLDFEVCQWANLNVKLMVNYKIVAQFVVAGSSRAVQM